MQKNQILVLTAFLSIILIFLALGIFFALDSGSSMGGMMDNSNSWIISIIFFGVAIVISIGLIMYFFNSKKTNNEENSQKIKKQKKSKTELVTEESNISVPLKTSKIQGYLSTGNSKIDNLLYGGIAPHTSVILNASQSRERDSFINKFLESGLKNNEITFYISCDPSFSKNLITEYPQKFHLIACYPISDESQKSAPNVYKVNNITNLTEINITLTKAIRKLGAKDIPRIAWINIVSDVLLQYGSVKTRKWLTDIMSMLMYDRFTILAIINPKIHPTEDVQALIDLFDGEIIINEIESTEGSERRLKIKRMNKQKYLNNEITLT